MKINIISTTSSLLLVLATSLPILSLLLPTTSAVAVVSASDDEEEVLDVTQEQKLEQEEERKLFLKSCDRICIFWCHCDEYTCQTEKGRKRRMMELIGFDPDTTNLDLLSENELRELEVKAQDILVHNHNDEHHRALLFGLFGKCELVASVYDKRYISNKRESADMIPKNVDDTLQLITEIGGNPEATYSYQHNVIDNDEANRIIDYMEIHPRKEYTTKQFNNIDDTYEFYHVDMTGTEFVPLIGKERMQELINLMQVHSTVDHPYLPITRIRGFYLPPNPNMHLDYHMDSNTHVTLIIELNEGFEGGEIVYLTGKDGAILHSRSVGSAFLHGPDMVHGLMSHDGKGRYALYILSDMNTMADPALTKEALSSMV